MYTVTIPVFVPDDDTPDSEPGKKQGKPGSTLPSIPATQLGDVLKKALG